MAFCVGCHNHITIRKVKLSRLSAQELRYEGHEWIMKKDKTEKDDELRPEYDLKNLKLRKVGSGRKAREKKSRKNYGSE